MLWVMMVAADAGIVATDPSAPAGEPVGPHARHLPVLIRTALPDHGRIPGPAGHHEASWPTVIPMAS